MSGETITILEAGACGSPTDVVLLFSHCLLLRLLWGHRHRRGVGQGAGDNEDDVRYDKDEHDVKAGGGLSPRSSLIFVRVGECLRLISRRGLW